jgi:hypothetical protein
MHKGSGFPADADGGRDMQQCVLIPLVAVAIWALQATPGGLTVEKTAMKKDTTHKKQVKRAVDIISLA